MLEKSTARLLRIAVREWGKENQLAIKKEGTRRSGKPRAGLQRGRERLSKQGTRSRTPLIGKKTVPDKSCISMDAERESTGLQKGWVSTPDGEIGRNAEGWSRRLEKGPFTGRKKRFFNLHAQSKDVKREGGGGGGGGGGGTKNKKPPQR